MVRGRATAGILVSLLVLAVASPAGAVPVDGMLFATDGSGGNLVLIDPGSGAGVNVGAINAAGTSPSLATDPTTGTLYGGGGGGNPNVLTIDPNTGNGTLLGASGLGFAAISALDFDAGGVMFASVNIAGDGGTGADHLATIDLGTGQASVIGSYGTCTGVPALPVDGTGSCDLEGMEAIAFDGAGNLFGAINPRGAAGTPGLYSIDPLTGAATFIAAILDSTGGALSGGVVSLQFHTDGNLYGGSGRAMGAAGDGGFLVTIDPVTGEFAFVGAGPATELDLPVAALAGLPPAFVPEPAPALLIGALAVGLLGRGGRRRGQARPAQGVARRPCSTVTEGT
jgi:hypothetical protein